MTLFAARTTGSNIKVSMTYGPIAGSCEEDEGHVVAFYHDLGRLLGDAKNGGWNAEQRAREGYERYRQHAGGVSKFSGDALPAFDDQDDETRGHWVAAFSEG